MRRIVSIIAAVSALAASQASAATVLYCPFDSLDGWSVRTVGAVRAGIAGEGKSGKGRHAELRSSRGTAFLSRELPLEAVRGCRVTVSCSVRCERIVRGAQLRSTGKIHLAVRTPTGTRHSSAGFVGTSDWHREGFTADVPADAQRVVLNLGLESCSGRALFDRLIVRNDRRGVYQLDLAATVNAGHGQLALGAFPKGTVQWKDVSFHVLDAARHAGRDCFRLKGLDRPDWPASMSAPLAVGKGASAIYLLHAALGGREKSQSPCAIWTAKFVGGHAASFSVFEGREIGAVGAAKDLENWHVAWRGRGPSGKAATFGVTKWTVYSEMPIVSLSCQAYRGAAPVVLGVTVVEEPPQPPSEGEEYDDMGGPSDGAGLQ